VLPLEEAVRKMTSQAAIRVGVTDRASPQGMPADITIFDPRPFPRRRHLRGSRHYAEGIRFGSPTEGRGSRGQDDDERLDGQFSTGVQGEAADVEGAARPHAALQSSLSRL
jgi:hypothetical protein